MPKSARSRLYVDKEVQRALLWQLIRHWALFIVVPLGMVFAFQMLEAGPSVSLGKQLQATWYRYAPMLVAVVALFPVFAYDSIKLSHRFVGPIVRLHSTLRQAALGESVQPLQFREGDFWQDIATSFNALLKRLSRDRTTSREFDDASGEDRYEQAENAPELSTVEA